MYDQIDAGIKTYPTNAANIYGVNLSLMSEQELFDTIWSWFYSNPDIYIGLHQLVIIFTIRMEILPGFILYLMTAMLRLF